MFSEEGTVEKSKKFLSDEDDIAKVADAAAICKVGSYIKIQLI